MADSQSTRHKRHYQDLAGQVFGQLTVVRKLDIRKRRTIQWLCYCSCGNHAMVSTYGLTSGQSKSCGCFHKTNLGIVTKTHGKTDTPEHRIWRAMKTRCYNPKSLAYRWYGGKIKVCERWIHSFENFLADMGVRPGPEYTIERRDNDGDYCPENCCWKTRAAQAKNRRTTKNVTYEGTTLCLADWARRVGVCASTLCWRLENWPIEKALSNHRTPTQ